MVYKTKTSAWEKIKNSLIPKFTYYKKTYNNVSKIYFEWLIFSIFTTQNFSLDISSGIRCNGIEIISISFLYLKVIVFIPINLIKVLDTLDRKSKRYKMTKDHNKRLYL